MKRLYEASMEGSVAILNLLIQKDPLILSKISLTTFCETPLHISALLGHVDFTRQLLAHKPKGPQLAAELDLFKRAPLHLASAEGHAEIVQALLHENGSVCWFRDQDEKIPLHYAAMRGHIDVIILLVRAQPESILETLASGETVLHLAVQYNHLEALKLLVKSVGYDNDVFLNMKESDGGNTILHLAVMLNQIETIKYLLSIPGVRTAGISTTNQNQNDRTAYDMVELFHPRPRDIKIQSIFMEYYKARSFKNPQDINLKLASKHRKSTKLKLAATKARWWRKCTRKLKYKGDWVQDIHGSLMVVATVISTMTFQTAINPPGGVWQENNTSTIGDNTKDPNNNPFDCSEDNVCVAGTAVLARAWDYDYLKFMDYNTTAFLASLSVTLLLISGFPLKNKICMWFLSMAMCLSLTFMALTFLQGMFLVTPTSIEDSIYEMYKICFYTWIILLAMIGAHHTVRLLIWTVKKRRRQYFKRKAVLRRRTSLLFPA
ncbi:hypothetical protein FNV43_RR06648 [Rhamnella rubrinervis]|uniref:PGG domain-containing protein n=1 Tax=Rhamnella rubrinervis TaxID=2594499 RepID=A0A8K0MLL2_9ROSA|nr:hypothetical protein FNV43_RR06648 [Rhamnella rubrinervis]